MKTKSTSKGGCELLVWGSNKVVNYLYNDAALDNIYNFVVDNIFIENDFDVQILYIKTMKS